MTIICGSSGRSGKQDLVSWCLSAVFGFAMTLILLMGVLLEWTPYLEFRSVFTPGVYRPGGPHALVTSLCVMDFDRERGRFRLARVHPGHSVEEVRDNTGFEFDLPESVPETPLPDAATLALIRGDVAAAIANPYPAFAQKIFGVEP